MGYALQTLWHEKSRYAAGVGALHPEVPWWAAWPAASLGIIAADLVLYAALLIIVFGVGLGVLSGLRRGVLDTSIVVTTTVFAAVPSFVATIVLLSVFSVNLGWFPALGAGYGGWDTVKHLTLPAIALALSAMALSWAVTHYVFEIPWSLSPEVVITGLFATIILVTAVGVASTVNVLNRKPLKVLRSE